MSNQTEDQIEKMTEYEFRSEILSRITSIDKKVDPMYEVFTSVNGFSRITVLLMKILGGIAISLGGLYALIELFRKLGR